MTNCKGVEKDATPGQIAGAVLPMEGQEEEQERQHICHSRSPWVISWLINVASYSTVGHKLVPWQSPVGPDWGIIIEYFAAPGPHTKSNLNARCDLF